MMAERRGTVRLAPVDKVSCSSDWSASRRTLSGMQSRDSYTLIAVRTAADPSGL